MSNRDTESGQDKNYTVDEMKAWGLNIVDKLERAREENRILRNILISSNIPFENQLMRVRMRSTDVTEGFKDEK